MQVAVEIVGLNKLVQDYNGAPQVIKEELNRAVKFAAVRIQREAKIEAPVDTGNLRSQIRFTNLTNGRGTVGSYAQYSIYVHEGTRHMKANPFMDRALNSSRADLNVIFSKAVANIGMHLAKGL